MNDNEQNTTNPEVASCDHAEFANCDHHPENDYAGLQVNAGIEQPPMVNPDRKSVV